MDKNKNNSLTWVIGIVGTAIIILLLCILGEMKSGKDTLSDGSQEIVSPDDAANGEVETKTWNTDIKDWEFSTDSGEKVHYYTPNGYCSLTDQYLDNLKEYYSASAITSDSMVVVGDAASPYDAKTIINANKLSDTFNMLKQLYGEDFDADEMIEAEALTYTKTGKLPDELPLNYKLEELETYEIDGIKYHTYEVNFDTEYEVESDNSDEAAEGSVNDGQQNEKEETKKEIVHTQQISCYSDTEDPIEIIVYQTEFSRENAVKALEEFLGVDQQ